MRDLAFMLQDLTLSSEATRLLENSSLETIQSNTVTITPLVEKLFKYLVAGLDIQSRKSHMVYTMY